MTQELCICGRPATTEIAAGKYTRKIVNGVGRWVGPMCSFHDDETHRRLLGEK